MKNKRKMEKSPDVVMEETLKGIFEEVNGSEEQESKAVSELERGKEAEKEASDLPDGDVSGSVLDLEAAEGTTDTSEETLEIEDALDLDEAEDLTLTREMEGILDADGAEALEEESILIDADDAEELEEDISLDVDEAEELEPRLFEEDGENFEGDIFETEIGELLTDEGEQLTEEEKHEKRRKRRKVIKIVAGSIGGVILAVYLGFSVFFMSHFQFQTTINGVGFSMKSVEDVEAYMEEQVNNYVLSLNESDGDVEQIAGSDVSLTYRKGDELKKVLEKQNAFLWPMSLWEKPEITTEVGVEYDSAKLSEIISGLACMKEENQIAPVSAKPEFVETEFVIKAEEVGSQIDKTVFEQKVKEYIEGFRDTLDMTEEECYVKPKYTSESPEVAAVCEEMNKYLGAEVTYTFGSSTEVVDSAQISQWLSTDENMKITFNEDAVKQYIQDLASKYNTYQKQRTFVSGNGNTVNVEGGSYGWIIDKDTEYEALINSIKSKEVVTKEPAYSQKAASHGSVDWGTTYVEVDLTNQQMWLFVNGAVVVSGPIVTGKPSAGDATPQGVYSIRYCQKDAVLRGPKQEDGTYEWESPVSFWMPFNGGIGLHDAPWQAAFGGSRYLTHGSHGCVNLQYSVAQTVYNNVQAGTPVICHY